MSKFHSLKQHTKKRSKLWIVFLLPIVIIGVTVAIAAGWYTQNLRPVSSSDEQVVVTIPIGATVPEIADTLLQRGLIRSTLAFDIYTRIQNDRNKLQAGGYKLMASQSVSEIVDKLVSGDVATDLFTILPAQRLDQVKSAFIQAGFNSDEVKAGFDPTQYAEHPALQFKPRGESLEGYLYPESYQRTSSSTVESIIVASLDQMALVLTPSLEADLQKVGLNMHDAVILASIVEREVPAASGVRSTVAQVYLKRLNESILLQADPTAQYGTLLATGTEAGWKEYDTPYNTYIYSGLPPGPIVNVSASALYAVANPTQTDYLYFVADDADQTTTHFSRTLEEHEAATIKYCKVKCSSY